MIAVVGRWGRRWLAGAAWAGVALVVAIGPLLVRVAWEGRAELIAADEAAAAGRVDLEIVHLGRAARWRAPFAASDDAAIGRLLALGAVYEADEATLTTALASGASFDDAARLANYAGGLVVMKRGTATVSQQELKAAITGA